MRARPRRSTLDGHHETMYTPDPGRRPALATDSRRAALDYHEHPVPGKTAVVATKPLTNQSDLALAYSPGSSGRRYTT